MDAIRLLKTAHQDLRGLFRQYESAGDHAGEKKQELADRIIEDLKIHFEVEEQIFYPALDWAVEGEEHDVLLESLGEQREIEDLIFELDGVSVMDDAFEAKFSELRDRVEEHIGKEEKEVLRLAEDRLESGRSELGTEMERLKAEIERMREQMRRSASPPHSSYMPMPE